MTTPNTDLAYRVLDHIDAHPETWHQLSWMTECGTKFCFAGWAINLSGGTLHPHLTVASGPEEIIGLDVEEAANRLLGIDNNDTAHDDLYDGFNTREDLGRIVEELFGPRPPAVTA